MHPFDLSTSSIYLKSVLIPGSLIQGDKAAPIPEEALITSAMFLLVFICPIVSFEMSA